MKLNVQVGIAACVLSTAYIVACSVVCAATSAVIYHNVMVPMRDGVRLATDIYVPSDDGLAPSPGRFPVLLLRTPYDKDRLGDLTAAPLAASVRILSPYAAVSRGVCGGLSRCPRNL
jgi:predicted acyl esterase